MHSLKAIIATALLVTVGFTTVNALPVSSSPLLRRDGEYNTSVSISPYDISSSYRLNNEEEKTQRPYYITQWTDNGIKNTYFENHTDIATSSEPVEPKDDDRETQIGTTDSAEYKYDQYSEQPTDANADSYDSRSMTPEELAKYGDSISEDADTAITGENEDDYITNETYNTDDTATSSTELDENNDDDDDEYY
jgi:hypothetical protein